MNTTDPYHGKGIVFFDGYCNLCNGVVRLLLRIDRHERLLFSNFDSALWRKFSSSINPSADSIVFVHNGKISIQSQAVVDILALLSRPWRWLAVARHLPFALREGIYAFIARNRYRIFGRKNVCELPPAEVSHRFV